MAGEAGCWRGSARGVGTWVGRAGQGSCGSGDGWEGGGGGAAGGGLHGSLGGRATRLVLCQRGFPLLRRVRGLCFSTESQPECRRTKQSCSGSKLYHGNASVKHLCDGRQEMACTGWARYRRCRGRSSRKTKDARDRRQGRAGQGSSATSRAEPQGGVFTVGTVFILLL